MKLNYNIIWVEDKIDTRPFISIKEKVKKYLEDEFFNVFIETAEDFKEFKQKYETNEPFDLIITDLNLNDSHGNEVIDFVRDEKHILTEVFFYSANSRLSNIHLVNNSRITFHQMDEASSYRELENTVIELINLTIKKFQHIVAMRGMIMHETSSLDVEMIEVIKKALINQTMDFTPLSISIYDELIQLFETKSNFVKSCKERENFNQLTKDNFVYSAKYKILTLSKILNDLGLVDFSEDYDSEINTMRNKFAHAILEKDEDGREYFKYKKDGIDFNEDLCKLIRGNINKHKLNLEELKSKISE